MGHLLDIEFDPKNNPKVLTKVISHWWGLWSLMRWFYILIGGLGIMMILIFISRCWLAKRPVENFSVLYKADKGRSLELESQPGFESQNYVTHRWFYLVLYNHRPSGPDRNRECLD